MTKAQLSKADKIRKLLHLSNAQIERRTGVAQPYIRAVRQRTSASGNPILGVAESNWRSREDYPARNRAAVVRCQAKRRAEARAS